MKTNQTSRFLPAVLWAFSIVLAGCNPANNVVNNDTPILVESSFVEEEYIDYSPKTTFTSIGFMESLGPAESEEWDYGVINDQYLDGCYYVGDSSTPFLASFAERWNKAEFLRRFVNAVELFERLNNGRDSTDTETIHGEMPMVQNEYQLAFRSNQCRDKAKKLVQMLSTIDYTEENIDKLASSFTELVNVPYDTKDFITQEEMDATEMDFWSLYDKSKYVADIAKIQKIRIDKDADYDTLVRMSIPLQRKYVQEIDFDAKCIYALEMACYGATDAIDYLGELIEDGRYSKYLFEIWVSWRLLAQSRVFGISTWSEIPDNLYDNARLLVAKTYVKHVIKDPSDILAKLLLLNLIYTENLHRAGGYYGNEALGAELLIRERGFVPDAN